MHLATGLLHPFAEPAKHGLTIGALACIQGIDGLNQPRFQFVQGGGGPQPPRFPVFFQTAQARTDDFARGLVQAAVDFLLDKFFQFRR